MVDTKGKRNIKRERERIERDFIDSNNKYKSSVVSLNQLLVSAVVSITHITIDFQDVLSLRT